MSKRRNENWPSALVNTQIEGAPVEQIQWHIGWKPYCSGGKEGETTLCRRPQWLGLQRWVGNCRMTGATEDGVKELAACRTAEHTVGAGSRGFVTAPSAHLFDFSLVGFSDSGIFGEGRQVDGPNLGVFLNLEQREDT